MQQISDYVHSAAEAGAGMRSPVVMSSIADRCIAGNILPVNSSQNETQAMVVDFTSDAAETLLQTTCPPLKLRTWRCYS